MSETSDTQILQTPSFFWLYPDEVRNPDTSVQKTDAIASPNIYVPHISEYDEAAIITMSPEELVVLMITGKEPCTPKGITNAIELIEPNIPAEALGRDGAIRAGVKSALNGGLFEKRPERTGYHTHKGSFIPGSQLFQLETGANSATATNGEVLTMAYLAASLRHNIITAYGTELNYLLSGATGRTSPAETSMYRLGMLRTIAYEIQEPGTYLVRDLFPDASRTVFDMLRSIGSSPADYRGEVDFFEVTALTEQHYRPGAAAINEYQFLLDHGFYDGNPDVGIYFCMPLYDSEQGMNVARYVIQDFCALTEDMQSGDQLEINIVEFATRMIQELGELGYEVDYNTISMTLASIRHNREIDTGVQFSNRPNGRYDTITFTRPIHIIESGSDESDMPLSIFDQALEDSNRVQFRRVLMEAWLNSGGQDWMPISQIKALYADFVANTLGEDPNPYPQAIDNRSRAWIRNGYDMLPSVDPQIEISEAQLEMIHGITNWIDALQNEYMQMITQQDEQQKLVGLFGNDITGSGERIIMDDRAERAKLARTLINFLVERMQK